MNQQPANNQLCIYVLPDDRKTLDRRAQMLKRRGNYSRSDIVRLALARLDRTVRNYGSRWLQAEIDKMKEVGPESDEMGLGQDSCSKIETIAS